jgi:hypothetical protein
MSVDLAKWVEEQPDHRIQNIASRGIKLPTSEIEWTMSHMGSVMSITKLHRKIVVMYAVLKDMEVGQVLTAEYIANLANEYCRPNARIHTRMVSRILMLLAKWGYIQRIPINSYTYEYKRIK